MYEPRCIRIFYDLAEAEKARKIVSDGGFEVYVSEDRFGAFPLPHYGMIPRFRLYVDRKDIGRVGRFLKGKLK